MANTIIPAVGTRGRFVLKPPFDAMMKANTLYTMTECRRYDAIETLGQNIFELFYNPVNLTEANLQSDRTAGALLITLMSSDSAPLYVPSTYVQSFPDLNYKPYNQYIATLSFGPLPDDTIFDPVVQALQNAASDFLGVIPTVNIAYIALTDAITPEEHDNREAVRQAAIASRQSDYARLAEANATIALQAQRIVILEKIVKDNGLLD